MCKTTLTQMSEECSICLECISASTTGRVEMSCSHSFHLKCIGMWLNKNSSCPLCRSKPSEMEILEETEEHEIGSRSFHEMMTSREFRTITYSSAFNFPPVSEEPMPEDTHGIPARDIRLVSQQTGLTNQQCLDALRRNNGDIVNTIMELCT